MDNGKAQKRFKQESELIRLAFKKTHSGCYVENSLEGSKSGCWENSLERDKILDEDGNKRDGMKQANVSGI